MFRNKDVSGIAAIHHPLCHVDPSAGHVRLLIQISYLVDRAAVHHPSAASTSVRLDRCLCNCSVISIAHKTGASGLFEKQARRRRLSESQQLAFRLRETGLLRPDAPFL